MQLKQHKEEPFFLVFVKKKKQQYITVRVLVSALLAFTQFYYSINCKKKPLRESVVVHNDISLTKN